MQQAGIHIMHGKKLLLCKFQMYNSFQPLMICLSYTGMHAQMKRLATDFDKKALEWVENLTRTIQVRKIFDVHNNLMLIFV